MPLQKGKSSSGVFTLEPRMLEARLSLADGSSCFGTMASFCSGAEVSKMGLTRDRALVIMSSMDTGILGLETDRTNLHCPLADGHNSTRRRRNHRGIMRL